MPPPFSPRSGLRGTLVDFGPVRLEVAALAGPQFSVVSGGLLCVAGLAAVVRFLPQLLRYELHHEAAHAPADGTDEATEPAEVA